MNKIALLFIILSSSFSIREPGKQGSLKSYFFPFKEMVEPKIYKYVDKNREGNIQYWHMSTDIHNNDTVMTTRAFDENLNQVELFREKIDDDGSLMVEFTMINNNQSKESKPIDINVFKWSHKSGEKIKWSADYSSKYGQKNLEKQREFLGKSKNKKYENNILSTIKFKDTFTHRISKENWSDSIIYYQFSYYSKGLGMIEYERFLPDSSAVNYYLDDILTQNEWKKLNY